MTQRSVHRLIAARIKRLRNERGWSAAKLAEEMTAAGVRWDRSIVANFENGRRSYVTAEELVALGEVLDVAPAALLLPPDTDSVAEVAMFAGQMLRGPFRLEINADADGVTDWTLGGSSARKVDRRGETEASLRGLNERDSGG
ncbi:helix-turn-helix transcriptional regulator [Actinocorallia sp. B10E7]|uniref:helix-turn-helix domain-containing protein n=1 Tax=Actinocorallia sp. B10E7 TaxID=3153558 RepID=UPI00325F1AA8